jgi:hypothetical protein
VNVCGLEVEGTLSGGLWRICEYYRIYVQLCSTPISFSLLRNTGFGQPHIVAWSSYAANLRPDGTSARRRYLRRSNNIHSIHPSEVTQLVLKSSVGHISAALQNDELCDSTISTRVLSLLLRYIH